MSCPKSVLTWQDAIQPHLIGKITTDLVLAIIWQESDGDPWAIRYEPGYQYFYDWQHRSALFNLTRSLDENRSHAQSVLGVTEFHAQSISWGLMQLMGAAARERGFRSRMAELTIPDCNFEFGIKHLWEYAFGYGEKTTEQALQRWNGSAVYVNQVLSKLDQVRQTVSV